jgi:hypothetical protein
MHRRVILDQEHLGGKPSKRREKRTVVLSTTVAWIVTITLDKCDQPNRYN